MPDRIYIYQEVDGCAVEYGAVEYDALQLEYQAQRVILDKETAPSDTEVVDKTFAKVNKDGSQDLRFKYNPELPICLMGLLTLKSSQGLNILLEVSRASTVREFTEAFHLAVSSFPNPDKLVNSSNKDVSIKWDNPPLIINSSAQSTSHPEELVEGGYLPCPHCGYLNTPLDKQCNRCNAQLTNFFEDKEIA